MWTSSVDWCDWSLYKYVCQFRQIWKFFFGIKETEVKIFAWKRNIKPMSLSAPTAPIERASVAPRGPKHSETNWNLDAEKNSENQCESTLPAALDFVKTESLLWFIQLENGCSIWKKEIRTLWWKKFASTLLQNPTNLKSIRRGR